MPQISLLQLLVSSTVIAALVATVNAYFLDRFRKRLETRGFFREQEYAREYELFQRLWPAIDGIRHGILLHAEMLSSELERITPEESARVGGQLANNLQEPFKEIGEARPFIERKLYDLLVTFREAALKLTTDWRFPATAHLDVDGPISAKTIDELAETILCEMRARMVAPERPPPRLRRLIRLR